MTTLTGAGASPILITGPTASGKSALALAVAERFGGLIINADSMQVYRELAVLTARPDAADVARAPHRLYGHVPASVAYSVANWLRDVEIALAEARSLGLRPVIVGGTGLYFKALTEGLSPVPEIPNSIRDAWRTRALELSAVALHAELGKRDAIMAERLHPSDRQRVTRALEVIEATGRSLKFWQEQPGLPLIPFGTARGLVVMPPRDEIYRRCDLRFDQMVANGALDEVAALARLNLDGSLPAMRAIGVAPLIEHVAGRLELSAAIADAKLQTRHYVKRQETWIKRYNSSWRIIESEDSCEIIASGMQFIDRGA